MKKLLKVVIITALSVGLLYYVGVNALLASPWGEALFNQKPELVQIHYTRAWTLVPGQVEVEGFQLSMQDRLVQISITADRVHGNLHPWTLRNQRFVATQVTGDGVTLHVRPRLTKGDPLEKFIDELPPIPGYETPVRDVSDNEVQAGEIRFLSLEFADLTVHHLRELWIDRLRYTGDAEVTGGMLYEPFRKLRIDDGHFVDATSKLVVVAPNQVTFEKLDARVTLGEVNLGAMDFASLKTLVADLKVSATADPLFLNSYLGNVSGLSSFSAHGEAGPLELAVKIDHGVVQDGGRLTFKTPHVAVRIPIIEVYGKAEVTGKTMSGRITLDVEMPHATVKERDGQHLLDADRFALLASSNTDLTVLADVDAQLLVSGGHVKTLASLNEFIPRGAGVFLTGGSGLLSGTLNLESVPARARGQLDLIASDVEVKNRNATLSGHMAVHGEIRSVDFGTGALNLSGSTIALTEATLEAGGRTRPMWLRVSADPCLLTPKAKVLWSTTVSLSASNLEPLLAIIAANVPVPKALNLISDSPNLKAEATLLVRPDGVELPKVLLTSQNLRAEAALSLREAAGKRLEPWGNVLAHLGILNAGVEFEGPKVTVVLFDLDRWAASRKLTPVATIAP